MDAKTFDIIPAKRDERHTREERIYRGILQGIEEFQHGNTTTAKDGFAAIRERRNWQQRHTG